MILIVTEIEDPTTDVICKWLTFFNQKWLRINDTDVVTISDFKLSNFQFDYTLKINSKSIRYSSIKSFYYRRGIINFYKSFNFETNLNFFLKEERFKLMEFVHYSFELKPSIGKFERTGPNKLKVLKLASELEILIPNTYITDNKTELTDLLKNEKLISKAIFEPINFSMKNFNYTNPTVRISNEDLKNIEENFNFSLLQNEIKKEVEVRSFYLDGIFYSMAILSQNNEKTEVDYRNYDSSHPNRTIPIKLPLEIESKLNKLMNILNYNIGCIDLIFSNSNYYFLEVNPVGQFGMISNPCGYNLEKIIAEKLINIS